MNITASIVLSLIAMFFNLFISTSALSSPAVIRIDGSSTVYPITEAVAEEYRIAGNRVRITVGISGTGGGFKKFCAKEIDILDASRRIRDIELKKCKENNVEFVELPIAYDAITVIVNPSNTWVKSFTIEELKKIWKPEAQGKVVKWSDINPKWPQKPLNLYGPGVDSGTYDYFTEVVVGETGASRGDYTSSEDDNVIVQGVINDPNALGFVGLAYYEENAGKLKTVPIVNPKTGKAVLPSVETAARGEYAPLSRPLFIYVRKSALTNKSVRDFVNFYLNNAPQLATEVGYIRLPDSMQKMAMERFQRIISNLSETSKSRARLEN